MMPEKVSYRQLRQVLERLGYSAESIRAGETTNGPNATIFRHPASKLFVILRRMKEDALVRPVDLRSVRNTLANAGIVPTESFESLFRIHRGDSLIWIEPATGEEVAVTAASDDSDGIVIIEQQGTFSPCPADQLRKVDRENSSD